MSYISLTVKSIEYDVSNLYSDDDILRILHNEFPSPPQQEEHEKDSFTLHDTKPMEFDDDLGYGYVATATTTSKSSPPPSSLYPTIDDIELAIQDIDCDQLLLDSRVKTTIRGSNNNNVIDKQHEPTTPVVHDDDDDDDDSLTAFLLRSDVNDDDEDSIDVLLRGVDVSDDDSLDALLLGGATQADAALPREITFPAAAESGNSHDNVRSITSNRTSISNGNDNESNSNENISDSNSNCNNNASISNDSSSNNNGTTSNISNSNGSDTSNSNETNSNSSNSRKRNRDSEPTGIRKPPRELREQRNRRKLVRHFICLTNEEATVTTADETAVSTADETASGSVSSTVSSSSGDSVVDSMWIDDDEDVQDITSRLGSFVLFDDVAHMDNEADQNITALSSSIHYGAWSINREFVYWQISSSSTRFSSSC